MAQDLTQKRRGLARAAEAASRQVVDGLRRLLAVREERAVLAVDFQDADFIGEFAHLTPGMVGTLLDFVVPSLEVAYIDTANAGRNKQILLQMRGAGQPPPG